MTAPIEILAEGPEDGLRFLGEMTPDEIMRFLESIGIVDDVPCGVGLGDRSVTCPISRYLTSTYDEVHRASVGWGDVWIVTKSDDRYGLPVPPSVTQYLIRADKMIYAVA